MAQAAWRWRPNNVIGKVVPLLLLLYMVLAYRLVVVDFLYARLVCSEGRLATGYTLLILIHCLFLPSLWAYLRIFLARPISWEKRQIALKAQSYAFGANLSAPPIEPPREIQRKDILFECDEAGQPMRCYRDQCKGRWKPARSRHCGDCRQCRVALDHHCPWFDADVSAPDTLVPFLLFLSLIPPLLTIAFLPLLDTSWRHVKWIWQYASQSKAIDAYWWSRKRSWLGGPMYRWIIGLWLGSRECCRESRDLFDSPNLYIPVIFLLALALIFVAFFLLLSTLVQLIRGDLNIDVEIRKALMRGSDRHSNLKSHRYFSVPLPEYNKSVIVACSAHEQPYHLGSWTENLRAFLCLPPYTAEQLQLQWPISPAVHSELLARARAQLQKDQ